MKLHLDQHANLNIITGHGPGQVLINQQPHQGNLIVTADRVMPGWATQGFEGLCSEDFAVLAGLGASIVLIGTGARQRFPSPALLRPLIEAQIGYEIMDFAAACRTYNILAAEGRGVAAALILP